MPETGDIVPIVLLGDDRLRTSSTPVDEVELQLDSFKMHLDRLALALQQFRDEYGIGRAISAPQIGWNRRVIAVNLGQGTFFVINPTFTWRSEEMFSMWDDCMSFPWLMVKLRRHRSTSISYTDVMGKLIQWNGMDTAASELLQHEMDHLDGVLAVDRAMDSQSIIQVEDYTKRKDYYHSLVDYHIIPTVSKSSFGIE
ncbi:N-formylmethionyl-tRNA deformylase [Planoprotostelium fungivorum]|uniref:Peptide deformylase n=1 Tax=Planoprotostelium fungivorum TaxID=1890364 RepID=A0A2P6NK17_9EUKA|nr:N-formylmethionyl-tRNA deformylase [Planoprotostelium fungivorum]